MHRPFVPAVLLLMLPALLAACRLGWMRYWSVRLALLALAGAIAVWSAAVGGMDFDHLKRVKMLLAAATAAVLAARALGALTDRRQRLVILAALAASAGFVHSNFLAFHGSGGVREFVHLHDVAHYYLGSKYFEEIAHADLYVAMIRAEADRVGPGSIRGEIRNLRDNSLLDAQAALRESDVVKAAFTPTRWQEFQADVGYFRRAMGPLYRKVLLDFGYNPTPLWTILGGSLANLVPAGNERGIRALSAIDPLLELATFAILAWALGIEVALIATIYFFVLFGASFGWLGGAILRHLWFASLLASACLLRKNRPAGAGALLAVATALRVFPAFFALGPLAALIQRWRRGEAQPHLLRFVAGLVLTGVALFALTYASPRGLESWAHFQDNMQRHVGNVAFNTVGLTRLLQPLVAELPSRVEQALDGNTLRSLLLVTALPLAMLWLFRRSDRGDAVDSMTLGLIPLFVALDLACYYYVALVLLVLQFRNRPAMLGLMFVAETASYAMRLFEDREATVFLYRNVIVAMLLASCLLFASKRHVHADTRG